MAVMAAPQFKAVLIATQAGSESGLTFRSKQSAVWPADPLGRRGFKRNNMKIGMYCMTVLMLACSASLFGQTAMTGDSVMKKSDAMGKQMTNTGCIAEKDGK
jgi:hypothetical protein